MKVKDLIEELLKHDPEKEVFIQQGEDDDCQYLVAYTVQETLIVDISGEVTIDAVVIDYM